MIQLFSDGQLLTGENFEQLINSLKSIQIPVPDPTNNGFSLSFIDSISQDAEGVITATKKRVNFSGYQTVAQMIKFQNNDIQVTGSIKTDGSGTEHTVNIKHNKNHYPTVRLLDSLGIELPPTPDKEKSFMVKQEDTNNLSITIPASLNTTAIEYTYILD